METGKIIELVEREFGYIKQSGVKDHLFFHADDLKGLRFAELHKGDRVQFSITQSLKGPYATHVMKHGTS
jgi:cold shock CspA family protein